MSSAVVCKIKLKRSKGGRVYEISKTSVQNLGFTSDVSIGVIGTDCKIGNQSFLLYCRTIYVVPGWLLSLCHCHAALESVGNIGGIAARLCGNVVWSFLVNYIF